TQETPLHYCARAGNENVLLEIVNHLHHRILLSINKQDMNGWSPLLWAADQGHLKIVKILLKNHARVDIFDDQGMTALHLCADKGHGKVADLLLRNKAFVNARTKQGMTPLHLSARSGFHELLVSLIDHHGAKVDALTMNRRSVVHLAAQNGKLKVCEALLTNTSWNVDVSASDMQGLTPLHLAARHDHSNIVKLFLSTKPDLVTRSSIKKARSPGLGPSSQNRSDREQSTGTGRLCQKGDQPGEKPSRREADSSSPNHAQDCSPGLIITVYYQALVLPKAR
ncbi:hypothetical protein Ciccas_012282, partial [Cichlidogyrus casuarinus]